MAIYITGDAHGKYKPLMDRLDKRHKIGVAYDLIQKVMEDTDEEKW